MARHRGGVEVALGIAPAAQVEVIPPGPKQATPVKVTLNPPGRMLEHLAHLTGLQMSEAQEERAAWPRATSSFPCSYHAPSSAIVCRCGLRRGARSRDRRGVPPGHGGGCGTQEPRRRSRRAESRCCRAPPRRALWSRADAGGRRPARRRSSAAAWSRACRATMLVDGRALLASPALTSHTVETAGRGTARNLDLAFRHGDSRKFEGEGGLSAVRLRRASSVSLGALVREPSSRACWR